jgi:UDP-2-acetamido-2,6-beta-L-arabino-hexul-4-ose reductase
MKILVTGAEGFIGKNLIAELKNQKYTDVFEYDRNTGLSLLETYTEECDFVFHLAGVNRPQNQEEFMEGNFEFTSMLLNFLRKHNNKAPIMLSSSIHAESDNLYGQSKKAGEDLLFAYSKETGAKVLIYRFPNVYGKWCRPNYNSAIATFCSNIAHDLSIQVNDSNVTMNLVYIDDVVEELINSLKGKENRKGDFCEVPVTDTRTLGEIVDLIISFK